MRKRGWDRAVVARRAIDSRAAMHIVRLKDSPQALDLPVDRDASIIAEVTVRVVGLATAEHVVLAAGSCSSGKP